MRTIKKHFCFTFLSILLLATHAQDSTWKAQRIDKLVTIFFPGEIETTTQSVEGVTSTLFSTDKGSATFQLQKTILETDSVGKQDSYLPFDEPSLLKVYEEMVTTFAETNPHKKIQQQKIVRDSLIGYQFSLLNDKGNPSTEGQIFLLNKAVYSIIYLDERALSTADRTTFFDSLTFAEGKDIEQMEGSPINYKVGYFIGRWGLYILMGIVLFAYLLRQSRRGAVRP